MGIVWLRFFTHPSGDGALRTDNERRAATAYARWRTVLRWTAALTAPLREGWRRMRLERAARHELDALPERLLDDLGLRRDVQGRVVGAPRRTEPMPRVVPAKGHGRVAAVVGRDPITDASRAAAGAMNGGARRAA